MHDMIKWCVCLFNKMKQEFGEYDHILKGSLLQQTYIFRNVEFLAKDTSEFIKTLSCPINRDELYYFPKK